MLCPFMLNWKGRSLDIYGSIVEVRVSKAIETRSFLVRNYLIPEPLPYVFVTA